jgi:hypothetical protein
MRRALLPAACALLTLGFLIPASPAFATPPAGAFLNPSSSQSNGPGVFISGKNDGTDKLYHFTVRAIPTTSGATVSSVRIQIEPPGGFSFVTIGTAIAVGTSDTWELKWDSAASGIGPGGGAVRALVTDSNGESAYVPSDLGQSVQFDNTFPTAEMTSPADGGSLSFDTNNRATLSGTASADTTSIDAFYTVSPPTTTQTWKECARGGQPQPVAPSGSTTTFSLTCTLKSGDDATQVQAVAVLPINNNPPPTFPPQQQQKGAGDAHRVAGASAIGNSVVISPASPAQSIGDCQLFTLQVFNSSGQNVSGDPVDVQVTGPNDNTYFATVNGKTDAFTAPNNPAASDAFPPAETTDTCDKYNHGSGGGSQQSAPPPGPGVPGAESIHGGSNSQSMAKPETKQIAGTTTDHGFTFALVSHSAGTSQIRAWDDSNGSPLPNDTNDNANGACPASGSSATEPCGVDTAVWEIPAAASLTLAPVQGTGSVGGDHELTVGVVDQHANPLPNSAISFSVTVGPNANQDLDGDPSSPPGFIGFCVTKTDGTCTKTYSDASKAKGADTINAYLDANGNQVPDQGELQATAHQVWGGGTGAVPTSLTLHPTKKQTRHRGQHVTFSGDLISANRSCVAGKTIVLFTKHGRVDRYRITPGDLHRRHSGAWAGDYAFVERVMRSNTYHTQFAGGTGCQKARAPRSGGVRVVVT